MSDRHFTLSHFRRGTSKIWQNGKKNNISPRDYFTSLFLFLEKVSLAPEVLGFFLGGKLTDLFTENENIDE